MDPARKEAHLARLRARCAEAGLPLTAQRRAVMEVLVERPDHPTVDQIHSAVTGRLPDVSRATVYRSLETMSQLGLLRRVEHPGSSVRFDANTDPHHHFLCTRCDSIADLPLDAVEGHERLAFSEPGATRRAEEIAVLVRGVCADCGG